MSFQRFLRFIEVPGSQGNSFLANEDLLPVPPAHRRWSAINFWSFWVADSANISTFLIASSMVGAGMTWWQAWLAVWFGYGISAVFLVLNAMSGAKYHIIMPAVVRSSWGVYGGLWPTLNRTVCAMVWYGVQAWIGGQAVHILILSIWPSFANVKNGIPDSGTDTASFVSFFIFSFLSLFLIWFPIHSIRHFFTLKAFVAPAATIGLFAWVMVKGKGAGELLHAPATIHGSEFGWTWVAQAMGCIANMATLIVNSVDFASRANKPSAVVIPQLIALPFCFAIFSLFGILIASTTPAIFGEYVWSPLEILERFLNVEGGASHGTRAGCAFLAIALIISQMGTNIAANSLSAGCDSTALMPRFMTIRRGGYLAALIGFCICPWHMAEGSSQFGNYLSAYSVFLSSIAGVMICHYFLVSKQRIKVADLYTTSKDGLYQYKWGINFRAVAAYLSGLLMNVVGFAGAVGTPVPLAATRIYNLSFFTGFGVSALVYFVLCKVFPIAIPTAEEALDEVPHFTKATGVDAGMGAEASLRRSSSYAGEEEKKEYDEPEAVVKSAV
ncbi:hypothetical protein JCM10207_003241 [Rhodosporidiobolus poonsookiae]